MGLNHIEFEKLEKKLVPGLQNNCHNRSYKSSVGQLLINKPMMQLQQISA